MMNQKIVNALSAMAILAPSFHHAFAGGNLRETPPEDWPRRPERPGQKRPGERLYN